MCDRELGGINGASSPSLLDGNDWFFVVNFQTERVQSTNPTESAIAVFVFVHFHSESGPGGLESFGSGSLIGIETDGLAASDVVGAGLGSPVTDLTEEYILCFDLDSRFLFDKKR